MSGLRGTQQEIPHQRMWAFLDQDRQDVSFAFDSNDLVVLTYALGLRAFGAHFDLLGESPYSKANLNHTQ